MVPSLLVVPSLSDWCVTSLHELHAALARVLCAREGRVAVPSDTVVVEALDAAVGMFGEEKFFGSLVPLVLPACSLASAHAIVDARVLAQRSFEVTRRNAWWLLCNALFLNIDSAVAPHTRLDFLYLFQMRGSNVAVERILCLLHFLVLEGDDDVVRFARFTFDLSVIDLSVPLQVEHVHLHTDSMESHPNCGLVDFANSVVHIGEIIASATQEEVLFSCCPELFVLLVASEPLGDPSEVIVCENVRRFVCHSGYGESFAYQGAAEPKIVHEVLIVDASQEAHFRRSARDLAKVCSAFSGCRSAQISTGHWGCGVFGGNIVHKFVLQGMAAQICGRLLYYSCFGSDANVEMLEKFKQVVAGTRMDMLLAIMADYATFQEELCDDDDTFASYTKNDGAAGFGAFLLEKLALLRGSGSRKY